jgi:hypothetical protein
MTVIHYGCADCADKDREIAQLCDRIRVLEAGALALLQASEKDVPETEGLRRAGALAKLVGYDPGPQEALGMPPSRALDPDRMQREMVRLAELLRIEVEQTSPGWLFSLFLYPEQNGHVLHVARDRDRALPAIAKWVMERLDGQRTKARG